MASQRRRPPEAIAQRSRQLLSNERVATNEIVRFELLTGYTDELAALVSFRLDSLELLNMNRTVWDETRLLALRLKRAGLAQGLPDLLIAATAIHYDAVLVHADSDFETIAQYSDLRSESYVDLAQA